jgi:DNA-binding winged helix-turn-helix (wHTH) protein/Tfp pilus assembly protein PilF
MSAKLAYEFDGFRFEPLNLRLLYGTTVVPLTVKAADTLTVLVKQPGTVVAKEDLMAAVWPDTVVEENNLNQQISALRRALSQNGTGPLIETVPRRGYRFIGKVRVVSLAPNEDQETATLKTLSPANAVGLPTVAPANVPSQARPRTRITAARFRFAVGAALVLIAGVAAAGNSWYQRRSVARSSEAARELGDQLRLRGDFRSAIAEYERAIRLHPRNAMAHSGIAHALHRLSDQDSVRRAKGQSPSVAAALRAVELDPSCANCHGTLGFFLFYHDWEWERAEWHLREGIRLAPESAGIRPAYAMLLAATGRLDEALSEVDFALERQPHTASWRVMRSTFLYLQRRYPEALAATDHALMIDDTDATAWEWRSKVLFHMNRGNEAITALAHGAFRDHARALEQAASEGGEPRALQLLLSITDSGPQRVQQSWRRAPWHALLKDVDAAFEALQQALEYRNFNLIYIATDPMYDSLRDDPRFDTLLAGVGLDEVVPAVELARRVRR